MRRTAASAALHGLRPLPLVRVVSTLSAPLRAEELPLGAARLVRLLPNDLTRMSSRGAAAASLRHMNSAGLDAQARKRIEKSTRLMISYLDKLTGRMHQKMFPADDPLRSTGETAREKVQALHEVAKRLASDM